MLCKFQIVNMVLTGHVKSGHASILFPFTSSSPQLAASFHPQEIPSHKSNQLSILT
jgi:hypothetical protein